MTTPEPVDPPTPPLEPAPFTPEQLAWLQDNFANPTPRSDEDSTPSMGSGSGGSGSTLLNSGELTYMFCDRPPH